MKQYLGLGILLCLALQSANIYAAKVYKWYDDEGVVQYTDTAPRDRAFTVVTNVPKARNTEQAANPETPPAGQSAETQAGLDQEERFLAEQARVRAENCKNATANLTTLEQNARIRMMGEDGEFRYLTPEEKQQQVDQAKKIIAESCDKE